MKIAAYVDDQGRPLAPQEPGLVRIFERAHGEPANGEPGGGAWRHVSDTAFEGIDADSIGALTRRTEQLGRLLGSAEVLLVREVKGIAVTLLQNLGLNLWRIEGPPEAALGAVFQAFERTAREQPDPARFFEPGETLGEYRIDLAAVLAADSSLNSQLVLVPFLQQTPFTRLEVACEHPPRWLGKLLPTAGFEWDDRTEDGVCALVIRPSSESACGRANPAGGCSSHSTWSKGGGCSGGGCA
jgi:Fe-only nitrogenase accessory protein AnfO